MQHINNRLLSAVSWQYRWFVQGLRDTKLNTGRAGRRDKSFFKYSEILSSCQLVCYKFILSAPIKRWELNSATQFTTICLKAVWLPKALQEGNFSSFTHTLTSWWWSFFFVSIETVFKQFWSSENVIFFFSEASSFIEMFLYGLLFFFRETFDFLWSGCIQWYSPFPRRMQSYSNILAIILIIYLFIFLSERFLEVSVKACTFRSCEVQVFLEKPSIHPISLYNCTYPMIQLYSLIFKIQLYIMGNTL